MNEPAPRDRAPHRALGDERHLRVLLERGLVEETHPEFDARVRIYALRSGAMAELKTCLDTTERGWSEASTAARPVTPRA